MSVHTRICDEASKKSVCSFSSEIRLTLCQPASILHSSIQYGCERYGGKYGNKAYDELNKEISVLEDKYHVTNTAIAAAWILRHPAGMQIIAGTSSEKRLKEILEAEKLKFTREEWYRLYLAAGHILP